MYQNFGNIIWKYHSEGLLHWKEVVTVQVGLRIYCADRMKM